MCIVGREQNKHTHYFISGSMDPHSISIRLKFGEREKSVDVRLLDQIQTIKTREFLEDTSRNRKVRVIFRGKELKDNDTFQGVNMRNGDICHIIIGRRDQNNAGEGGDGTGGSRVAGLSGATESSSQLSPLDLFLIAAMTACTLFWMVLFSLPDMLAPSAAVLMTGLTGASSLACFARASRCS